jgi:putative restriction endonuclease
MTVSPVLRTRLEKAAEDNGFDLPEPPVGDWLCFRSSHAPIRVWLTSWSGATLIVAVSHAGVATALTDGVAITNPLPPGAVAARGVDDIAALDRLLRRTYTLARALPSALWRRFAEETADLPRATEAERLVVQRRGQALFRDGLMALWGGRCAITGLAVPALLRASHAKPWKDATDEERLDVYNGLLLSAHLDAAFDAGLITVEEDGVVRVSEALDGAARAVLGLDVPRRLRRLLAQHRPHLAWHRERVFVQDAWSLNNGLSAFGDGG